jgi:ubiquinone/menaquinone biosynthesis C-methylase UbiE
MSSGSSSASNDYIIDIESAAETARLIEQDKLFTRAMGGLLPEQPANRLASMSCLLDLACGPGGWTTNVAYDYPDLDVMGVDINPTMTRYASAVALSQGIKNASFEVMDIKKPLVFGANTFDLVNARLLVGFMDRASWVALIAECMRILKSGGILRFTEVEKVVSSSLALQHLIGYLYQVLSRQGRTFSVDGSSFGLVHMLGKLMQNAGFSHVQRRAFILDGSPGSELYESLRKDYEVAYILLKPYLIQAGIVDEATFDAEYKTTFLDMMSDDFTGATFGFTTWGVKA